MGKVLLLTLASLTAGGFWLAHHWDEARLTLGVEDPIEIRALRLAKDDYTLDRLLKNVEVIQADVDDSPDMRVIGWKAVKKSDRICLVSFTFTRNGTPGGYYFEVDTATQKVRDAEADPLLANKYGLTPPR
jgi:hypothetical protein